MTTNQAKIVSNMGFEICEFAPDSDPCEACDSRQKQLYFQGTTESGRYLCLDCILREYDTNRQDNDKITQLEKEGHTTHCVSRQVWGDGQCECMTTDNQYTDDRDIRIKAAEYLEWRTEDEYCGMDSESIIQELLEKLPTQLLETNNQSQDVKKRAETMLELIRDMPQPVSDTLRDLLAENERLEERLQAAEQAIGALHVSNVIEAAKDMAFKRMDEVFAAQQSEIARYKATLQNITQHSECGCNPCIGSCSSKESLQIELDEIRSIAAAALAGEVK